MTERVGERRDAFISFHEKTSGPCAEEIAKKLNSAGISYWFSRTDIELGDDFLSWMSIALHSCKVFIALLDEGTLASDYMKNEATIARKSHVAILPYTLPGWGGSKAGDWTEVAFANAQRRAYHDADAVERDVWEQLAVIPACDVVFLSDSGADTSEFVAQLTDIPANRVNGSVRETLWTLKTNDESLRLRCVEFGKEAMERKLYRCFLTPHTVYVVISKTGEDEKTTQWLDFLRHEAEDCKVAVALNSEDPSLDLNEQALKEANPSLLTLHRDGNIRHYFRVPLRDEAIASLIKAQEEYLQANGVSAEEKKEARNAMIQRFLEAEQERAKLIAQIADAARKMPIPNQKRKWDEIGKRISNPASRRYCISEEEFNQECDYSEVESHERRQGLQYLRRIGYAYYYRDKPEGALARRLCLNPHWLANRIMLLCERADRGALSYGEIRQILKDDAPEDADFVFQVMRKKGLALALGNNGALETALILNQLPMPDNAERLEDAAQREIQAKWAEMKRKFPEGAPHLRCKAPEMSHDFFFRLMSHRTAELDKEYAFQRACRFQKGTSDLSAWVEFNRGGLDIYAADKRGEAWRYIDEIFMDVEALLQKPNQCESKIIIYCKIPKDGVGQVSAENICRGDPAGYRKGEINYAEAKGVLQSKPPGVASHVKRWLKKGLTKRSDSGPANANKNVYVEIAKTDPLKEFRVFIDPTIILK